MSGKSACELPGPAEIPPDAGDARPPPAPLDTARHAPPAAGGEGAAKEGAAGGEGAEGGSASVEDEGSAQRRVFEVTSDASLDEGRPQVGPYALRRVLGEGSYGKVWSARDGEGARVAVKVVDTFALDEKALAGFEREAGLLLRARHPHVVEARAALEDSRRQYLVTEYLTGGDLHHQISAQGPLREDEACRLFAQLVLALSYCHDELGHCHGDVKLENMLFDNLRARNVKLVDFGLAHPLPRVFRHAGTPAYAAPEVITNAGDAAGDGGFDGAKADVWSAGVALFVLVCGHLPFADPSFFRLREKVCRAELSFPADLGGGARDLLRRMLEPDPAARLGLDAVRAHPWCAARVAGEAAAAALGRTRAAAFGSSRFRRAGSRGTPDRRRAPPAAGSADSSWYCALLPGDMAEEGDEEEDDEAGGGHGGGGGGGGASSASGNRLAAGASGSGAAVSPQLAPYRPVDGGPHGAGDAPRLTLSNLPHRRGGGAAPAVHDRPPSIAVQLPARTMSPATVTDGVSLGDAPPPPPLLAGPPSVYGVGGAASSGDEDEEDDEMVEEAMEAYSYMYG